MKTDVMKKIEEAEVVLIGLGEELAESDYDKEKILKFYNSLSDVVKEKNIFVVSINSDNVIFDSNLDLDRITAPYSDFEEISPEGDDKQWDKYMKWLSGTLNKKLVVLEFGVLLTKPNVIRWPFERVVMLNEKATLIRINNSIPQIPSELSEKAISIKDNPLYFFEAL